MEQLKKEEYGTTLLFTSEMLQLTFQSVFCPFPSSLPPPPLKTKTKPLESCPVPGAFCGTNRLRSRSGCQRNSHTSGSRRDPRSLLATSSTSPQDFLSGASQSRAQIIFLGLQFDQSEHSVLTGSLANGCAHVIPAAAADLSFSSLSPGSCGGGWDTRTMLGRTLREVSGIACWGPREVGKIRGVLVHLDVAFPGRRASWSASPPPSLELGGGFGPPGP